jgi:hypothetical protein
MKPLFRLCCCRDARLVGVVIVEAGELIEARMRAAIAGLDKLADFSEGYALSAQHRAIPDPAGRAGRRGHHSPAADVPAAVAWYACPSGARELVPAGRRCGSHQPMNIGCWLLSIDWSSNPIGGLAPRALPARSTAPLAAADAFGAGLPAAASGALRCMLLPGAAAPI